MCPLRWKLCVPRWSLSVADRVHKRKATVDQYVSGDDRLVPEKHQDYLANIYAYEIDPGHEHNVLEWKAPRGRPRLVKDDSGKKDKKKERIW